MKEDKTICQFCKSPKKHYYDCKIIRAEKISKLNSIRDPWKLPWNELVKKLEDII